jgi:F420-dependent oxidoreductase-like protein
MIELSIQVEGHLGLTWAHWKRLVAEVDGWGFAGLFRCDHFNSPSEGNLPALEPIVSLTYLADHSKRVHFGTLVAPLSFRDPVMLARQAAALDDLSGGRMILGVGAGWMESEHTMFGYDLGDVPTRLIRLEEGLEVITRLLRDDEPVTFSGRFYQLREAMFRPRPDRPGGPPILVGGSGPRRVLPLVARYADVWNANGLSPEAYRERSTRLDELLRAAGREPRDVRRTLQIGLFCGRNPAELEERIAVMRRLSPEVADTPLDVLAEEMRSRGSAIVGTPDEVVEQLRGYEQAGVQEVMGQYLNMDDFEGLQILAEEVVPRLSE